MTEPVTSHKREQRRRRARRWGVGSLLGMALLTLAAVVAGFVLMGRTITAPDWVTEQVASRAGQMGLSARFERMEVVVHKGWRPRARIVGLNLSTGDGAPIARLSSVEASLSMRALLKGKVALRNVEVDGVVAHLRRAADGRITLSGGTEIGAAQRQAASFAELIGGLDTVLMDSRLAGLRTIDVYGLTLGFTDARAGQSWTADGGRLQLKREGDALTLSADLALLGGGSGVASIEANYASLIGETEASFGIRMDGVQARDIATQGPAFAWLEPLRAPISGALRSGVKRDGSLAPLNATLQIGAGVLQPNLETRPIPFEAARAYFTYEAATGVMRVDEMSVRSEWLTGRVEGQAVMTRGAADQFEALTAQLRADSLSFNPFELYSAPVSLDQVAIDLRLTLDPFRVQLGQAVVRDQGQILTASGDLSASSEGWQFAFDARVDALARERLLTLWPEELVPNTRRWIDENLTGGAISGVDLVLRGAPSEPAETYLSFDFTDAAVRYARTLPPITGGTGHASLLRGRFAVMLNEGTVTPAQGGPVDVAGSSFIIPDVRIKEDTPSVVRLEARAPVEAVLSLLDTEPLSVLSDANLPVALASGQAQVSGTLDIPLVKGLKADQVRFEAAGTLRGVQSDVLIDGRRLAADRLAVTARNDGVRIAGQGTLDGVPFDAAWSQPLGPEASGGGWIDGDVELSARALDAFNIGLPPGSVAGTGSGRFSVTLPRGAPPELALRSDLRGVRMSLAPLGWSKPAGAAGDLRIGATLGPRPDVGALSLDAPGLTASGKIDLTDSGALASAVFDRVRVGGWLDAPVTLVGRGPGAAPTVRLQGGRIDLRNADFGEGGGDGAGQSTPLDLRLDTLQIADTIAITDLQGDFVTGRGLDGTFTGRINGGARVTGQVVPQNGRTAIRIRSDDAGGVFASAGIIRQARGGKLDLTLNPVGQEGAFDGTLRVTNTRVKDAPAIADLLAAISVVGLLEQLSGEGILFSEVEASFRLTPSVLTLTKGSAVGPSIGLSMDGRYGIEGGIMDMQGAISPVYLLNGIGSIFTRKGEGLIAFSYRLTGPAQNPRVSVNPLSALTPGLFREIFRRPPPDLPPAGGAGEVPQAFVPDTPAPATTPQSRADQFEGR
ncbi:MAG: AsmA-like C-terminal region-containing protein [Pseudomonadota bacterium]